MNMGGYKILSYSYSSCAFVISPLWVGYWYCSPVFLGYTVILQIVKTLCLGVNILFISIEIVYNALVKLKINKMFLLLPVFSSLYFTNVLYWTANWILVNNLPSGFMYLKTRKLEDKGQVGLEYLDTLFNRLLSLHYSPTCNLMHRVFFKLFPILC